MVNAHALQYGPFGYERAETLPGLHPDKHKDWVEKIRAETLRNRRHEPFLNHYFSKYDEEHSLPIWMACELMSFGALLTFFRGAEPALQKKIAGHFGAADKVMSSWLLTLNQVRNICAHHGRLWNRVSGIKPLIPHANKNPQWHDPVRIPNERLFGIFTVLYYLLKRVAPQSRWKQRLKDLFTHYTDIPMTTLGFPEDYECSPLWADGMAKRAEPKSLP